MRFWSQQHFVVFTERRVGIPTAAIHLVTLETPLLLRILIHHLGIRTRAAGSLALAQVSLSVQMVEQRSGIEFGKMPPIGA